MQNIIDLQKKIVPEVLTILEKRYSILRNIYEMQPIGRRGLANKLGIGERIIRTEVDLLKNQGLIEVTAAGMSLTLDGEHIINSLQEYIYKIHGIKHLEEKLKKKLEIFQVNIVPGDITENQYVSADMGIVAAHAIENNIKDNSIIGITGGGTMVAVAKGITKPTKCNNIIVVPARGGIGREVEKQANTITAEIARRLKCQYQLLHASDTLGQQALESVLKDPEIQKVTNIIKSVNLLVFGIGRADRMAERRELPKDVIDKLKDLKAVAEAFGYYFTREGKIIYEMQTIGISFKDFEKISTVIGVAGGKSKAEAIVAVSKLKKSMILVTDEAAAVEILQKY
ncbi:transcriptional regulator [Clostridium aceticum]|uniref:Transcriptional regulator n=1 Tax=Clostridium aceticum TaxID=84022 RepID=A0A0D8I6A0_9CLOT|nr:sugar-binding domain-containing protein [Clostridium aceticum]AKL94699.1 transcriptional regulator [Clostridium aceticum]KJF25552.1 Cro/Cl family transcriptional regulator [Clostridium aceticum]